MTDAPINVTAFLDTIFKPSPKDVKNLYDPRPARILEINNNINESMERYREMIEEVSHVLSRVNAYKMDRDLVSNAEPLDFTDLCEKITTTFNTVEKTAFHDGSLCVLTTDLIAKDNGGDGKPIKIEPHLIVLNIGISESQFIPVGDNLYEGFDQGMMAHPHCIGARFMMAHCAFLRPTLSRKTTVVMASQSRLSLTLSSLVLRLGNQSLSQLAIAFTKVSIMR